MNEYRSKASQQFGHADRRRTPQQRRGCRAGGLFWQSEIQKLTRHPREGDNECEPKTVPEWRRCVRGIDISHAGLGAGQAEGGRDRRRSRRRDRRQIHRQGRRHRGDAGRAGRPVHHLLSFQSLSWRLQDLGIDYPELCQARLDLRHQARAPDGDGDRPREANGVARQRHGPVLRPARAVARHRSEI